MFRYLILFNLLIIPFQGVSAEEYAYESEDLYPVEKDYQQTGDPIEAAIMKCEHANMALLEAGGTEEMESELDKISDLMKNQSNLYRFIEANGIRRVIQKFLSVQNSKIRIRLLSLLQELFVVAPATTATMTPIVVLDDLLDFYADDDDSLLVKKLVMSILFAWLPDNPKLQARVMMVKGFEPFYEQVPNLDLSLIDSQLKLFSIILKEHIRFKLNQTEFDSNKIRFYNNIGLAERLSSSNLCHGLFNVFKTVWEANDDMKEDIMVTVFEILTDVQTYCPKRLRGETEALELMRSFKNHLENMDETLKNKYKWFGLNIPNVEIALQKYIVKQKDEL